MRKLARFLAVPLLGSIVFITGCGKTHEPQAATGENLPPATVRVQTIEAVKEPAVEEVVGTVQPKLQAVIEAKVSGRITRLPVSARPIRQAGGRAGGTRHPGDSGPARPGQRRVPAGGTGLQSHRQPAQAKRRHPGRIGRRAGSLQRRQSHRSRGGGALRLREDPRPVRRRGGPQARGRRAIWRCPANRCSNWKAAPACAWWPMSRACSPAMCCRDAKLAVRVDTVPDTITGHRGRDFTRRRPGLPHSAREGGLAGNSRACAPGQFGRLAVPVSEADVPLRAARRRWSGAASLRSCLSPPTARRRCGWCAPARRPRRASRFWPAWRRARRSSSKAPRLLRDGQPLQTQ